jgi:glycerol uptake facilitator protein
MQNGGRQLWIFQTLVPTAWKLPWYRLKTPSSMQIFLAELLGTMLLIIFGDGVVANVVLSKTKGQNSGWIVITTGWAMAVGIGVYAVGAYSGAHINPAVTIALVSIGKVSAGQAIIYIAGQFAGAIIGAILVFLAYRDHFAATDDKGLKLAVFCTGPAIRDTASNLITEIIGTFALVFGVLSMLSTRNLVEKTGFAPGFGPFLVALLVWGIGLSLGGPTGYAINPARDLGPRIAHAFLPVPGKGSSDWGYSWIPVVGPIIGGVLGALIYTWTLGSIPAPTGS